MIQAKEMIKKRKKEDREKSPPAWSLEMIQTAAFQTMNETECLLSMDCLDGFDGWEVSSDGIFMHGKMY